MNFTKKQKDQITYLISALQTDEPTAIDLLKKSNWDSDRACDLYFSNPKTQEKKPNKLTKKTEDLFNKYKEPKEEYIGMEGVQQFFNDLNVEALDPVTLVISYYFKAVTMGMYTKPEFCNGMAELKCETMAELKSQLKTLRAKLDNEKDFKEVYRYTFGFAKDTTGRNLNFESAKALWEILLKGKFPFLEQWIEFLETRPQKNDVPKDLWNMLLEFHYATRGDLNKYVDDGAWPVMIDEFVEHLKSPKK